MGVFLSYVIPILGGIIGTCIVCFSNGMILSIVLKKRCSKQNSHAAVPTVELASINELI
tara:strand:- start:139 stop:315 length:177 start_codon:yes stop_codon:yes gene_type:complete